MSSISIPLDRIGAAAIDMLQDLIAQKPLRQKQVMLEPNFVIIRQSSDIFAVSDPVLRDALDYIRDHAHQPIVVNDVCEHAGGNRRTMERKCIKYTGRTLHQQIRHRRVNIAKKLLLQTELSIEQIATKCGFAEHERLTEAFIREVSIPPSVFRKEHRTKLH
jgi:LacI family transcriptional regulator